jgi:DNA-binding SARP family transcriptional activator
MAAALGYCYGNRHTRLNGEPIVPRSSPSDREMEIVQALRIHLFGQFHVDRGRQPLDSLNAPRVQELLSYLLLHRAECHARDALAGRLWPEEPNGTSRKTLRQTLWQLKRILDEGRTTGEPPDLLVQADSIGWNDAAANWLDIALLEEASAEVREAVGARLGADQVERLRHAVTLYRGELLEGWYQDWCLFERERLQGLYLGLLDKLMAFCEASRRYEEGIEYGTSILRVDQARERAHWRLMRLHSLLGDRTAALRQYQRCVAALKEDLGVAPAARTQLLYQQIRAGRPHQGIEQPPLLPIRPQRGDARRLRRALDAKETAPRPAADAPTVEH